MLRQPSFGLALITVMCTISAIPAALAQLPPPPPNLEPSFDPSADTDGDGIADGVDNCGTIANGDQSDINRDGYGDACISPKAYLGENVVISFGTVVERDAMIGDDVFLGERAHIGTAAQIGARSSLLQDTSVGRKVIVGDASYIDGTVTVEDYVVLGENCYLAYGTVVSAYSHLGEGVNLGPNVRLDKGVQIGNWVWVGPEAAIGAHSLLGDGVQVSEEVQLGQNARLVDRVMIHRAAHLGDGAELNSDATVGRSVQIGNGIVVGERSVVGNRSQVGNYVRIGMDSWLGWDVTVESGAHIGDRVVIVDGVLVHAFSMVQNDTWASDDVCPSWKASQCVTHPPMEIPSDLGQFDDIETDYCRPLATWICEQSVECGCTQSIFGPLPEGADCAEYATEQCRSSVDGFRANFDAGALTWRRDNAAECIAGIKNNVSECASPSPDLFPSACSRMLVSTAELGAACEMESCLYGEGECSSDKRCHRLPQEGDSCDNICGGTAVCQQGTCRTVEHQQNGAIGAPCTNNHQCTYGLACLDGVCSAASVGAACVNDETCTGNEFCWQQVQAECAPQLALDQSCRSSDQCAPGTYCNFGNEPKCSALPAMGETCGNGAECAAGSACSFLTMTCEAIPQEGQACAMSWRGPFVCAEGLGCYDGICESLATTPMEPCSLDGLCGGDLGCEYGPAGSSCVPRHAIGEPCMSSQVCQSGSVCNFATGTCAARAAVDEPCQAPESCGEGLTCLGDLRGGQPTCQPLPNIGDSCAYECNTGAFCNIHLADGVCTAAICGGR